MTRRNEAWRYLLDVIKEVRAELERKQLRRALADELRRRGLGEWESPKEATTAVQRKAEQVELLPGPDTARLMTLPEVAAVMQVSIRELRRLRASGCFGPSVMALGKRLQRVRWQELSDWFKAECPPATRWTWKGA